jgi:hypothetical protein
MYISIYMYMYTRRYDLDKYMYIPIYVHMYTENMCICIHVHM